jgi:hypothetical protein
MVVHLIPVRRSAHDVFGLAMGILVVTPLGSSQTLPDDLLNGLLTSLDCTKLLSKMDARP